MTIRINDTTILHFSNLTKAEATRKAKAFKIKLDAKHEKEWELFRKKTFTGTKEE